MINQPLSLCRNLPFALLMALAAAGTAAGSLSLPNHPLRVAFDPEHGRLVECAGQTSGHNFAGPGGPDGLWQAVLLQENQALLNLSPAQANRFEASPAGPHALRLLWSEFDGNQTQLQVEVLVELDPGDPVSRWKIALRHPGKMRPRQIRFPIVPDIPEQPDEHLAVPVWMGQLAPDPRQRLLSGPAQFRQWDYPGHTSMQCLALYGRQAGLCFSCDDTNAFRKSFALWTDADRRLQAGVIHLPETEGSKDYALPYQVLISTFQGDWLTAAERYRRWATNQWWAAESRLRKGATPAWAGQTALWVWNRGRSEQVLQPAAALREKLGLPVSVFWHWWHGCPYDVGFPEYLPPREGDHSFTNALRLAHAQGIPAIVYMNQRLWGMTTESWKTRGAEAFAVVAADGRIQPEVYNTFTKAPCASMCIATPFWRNTYASLAEEAIKRLGVDGIYMDQACSSLACYSPQHGHPIGGGSYWMNGFRLLATDLRQRCAPSALPPDRLPLALVNLTDQPVIVTLPESNAFGFAAQTLTVRTPNAHHRREFSRAPTLLPLGVREAAVVVYASPQSSN